MKKRLLSLLFAVCANAFAQSDSGIDMRLVEQAKAAGAQGAGIASQQFIEFDANGNPKLDASGKPIMRDNGPSAMKDSLNTFQKITGTTGVEQLANPAHSGRTGLAKVNVNQSLDVSCVGSNAIPGSVAAGGLVLKLGACEKSSGGQVSAIQVSVCGESAKGGLCAQASDYSSPVRVTAGAYSNLSGMSVGVGCNAQNKCLVSFTGSYSFGGSDESMKANVAQAASQSNVLTGLKKVVVEDDYAGKMREIGQPLADCAEANRVLSADGKYMTCDGSKQVTVQGPTETGECTGATRECLREAVDVQTYTRSCVRTFPLTQRISQLEYTRTQDCEIIEYYKPEYGTNSNSCTPAQTSGMTRIGSVTEKCAVKTTIKKMVNGKEVSEEICAADKRIEYNADVSNPVVRGITEAPSKVGGTCDLRAGSETKTLQCAGTWYGRTLPANECTGTYIDEWNNSATGTLQLLYSDKPGCGLCLQPQIGQTCYAVPTPSTNDPVTADREDDCSAIDTSICRLVSSTPQTYTGQGGLVSSQRDTFECKKETRHCVQWGPGTGDAACIKSDLAMGVDKIRPQANTLDASFNAAIIAAAQVDGTAKGLDGKGAGQDGEQLQNYPKLFGGENLRCNRPTGGFGQLLNKNCCRTNLERPKKGVLIQQGCGMDEVKLAAARRSSYAHYVGEYCSRKFLGACLRRTESYCVFQGILPRIIQEQGREQLEKMTANSTNAAIQRANITFNFYHSGAGAWSAPTVVNGVRVSAWQWPSYCASPAAAGEKLATDPNSKECPGAVSLWFAACDKAECGALPEQPQDGSVDWQMKMVNPLENVSTAVSRYSVVTGACAPKSQACNYSVAAWPLGVGGRAVVSRELTWDLFGQNEVAQSGVTPKQFVDNNMGDFIFRSFSENGAAGGAMPATVRLDFSRDGGQTWTQHQIPTSKKGEEISLANSDVKLVGFCEPSANACEFRATGTVVITAKPWGDAKNPDCSGYSPGQLSVLDFSRMDLSEWLATVMDKLGSGVDAAGLAQQAQAQGVAFNQLFQPDAVLTSNPPVAANFARVVPAEGFGPFKAKLAVSGYWPEVTGDPAKDKDKVLSATVDWGDCSAPQALEAVPITSGAGFRGEHVYEVPDSDNHACLKKSAADNLERNIVHSVTITVNTSLSGTKVRKVSVENAWAVFPGAEKNNDKVAHPENKGKLLESNNPASPMSSVR